MGKAAIIYGGEDDDSVVNFGEVTTKISTGAGNDTIDNRGTVKTIYGGVDNDNIVNTGTAETINAMAGKDIIGGDGNHGKISSVEKISADFSGTFKSKLYQDGKVVNKVEVNGK